MTDHVPGGVVKVIELVGSSPRSFSDAVRNAVRTASESIRNITGVEVLSSNADVDASGELTNYKVNCKIAFLVESSRVADSTVGGGEFATGSGSPDQYPPPA